MDRKAKRAKPSKPYVPTKKYSLFLWPSGSNSPVSWELTIYAPDNEDAHQRAVIALSELGLKEESIATLYCRGRRISQYFAKNTRVTMTANYEITGA